MCNYCHLYTAIGKPCEVCQQTPVAKSTSKPKRGKRERKVAAASRDIKPLSAATAVNRLHACGITDDSKIAAGLKDGAVTNALYADSTGDSEQVFLRYMLLVERVENEYPEVARFRFRMVSGVAA